MKRIYERIGYTGQLEDISKLACKDYHLGKFSANHLIPLGYEDFNFSLETTKGKYLVKVFGNFRDDKNCKRYIEDILKAKTAGVQTPGLLESNQGYFYKSRIKGSDLRLCVMEFIDGQTIYDLNEKLDAKEIKVISQQAALISTIPIEPKKGYDMWAIVNFLKEFQDKGKYLTDEDRQMVNPLVKKFKELKIEELPHCFVHGDIITTNVMKDKNGQLWIIDFSVSNYYPRIQELAILACNLFFDPKNKKTTENNLKIAINEYQKQIQLTDSEQKALPDYIKLAHAMHILEANYEKVKKGNDSEENEYWINQGRSGLKQILNLP
jgi:Ser/Thr protein kinase RdoA (MazF antagonist)